MKIRTRSILIVLFLTGFIFFSSSSSVQAATCAWDGSSGNWNDPTKWDCGYVPGVGDEAIIYNGTVSMTADAVVGELTLSGGTLTGAFNLSANTIIWNSGTMSGIGTTTATSAVDFTGSNQIYLSDRTFNNVGTATWYGTGSMYFNPAGTTFNNQAGATFSVVNSSGTVVYGSGTFTNAGTFTKSSAGSTNISLIFNNSGTVSVESGTLDIINDATSSSTGTYNIPTGATLKLSGTHNLSGSIPFTGSGTIEIPGSVNVSGAGAYVYGGTTLIPNGTLTLNSGVTASTVILNLTGGAVTGSGDLSAHTINWSSGTMSGIGTTTATSAVDFTGSNQIYLSDRTFNNAGTATWDRTGPMYFNPAGTTFNNQAGATFNVVNSGGTVVYGQGTFNNYGTLNLTTGQISTTTFRQEAGGVTNLAIRGTTPATDYSQLNVSDIYLSGPFNISFTGGYTPHIGDHFILLSATNRTGDFSPVNITPLSGLYWYLYYDNNTLHLSVWMRMFIPLVIR